MIAPANLFDAHGLVAGPAGQNLWSSVCLSLEERIHEGGWDQPCRLYAVSNPVETEARTGIDATTLVQLLREQEDSDLHGHARTLPSGAQVLPFPPSEHADSEPGDDHDDLASELDIASSWAFTELGEVDGLPADTLWGFSAPDWAAAIILVFEAWGAPPDVTADTDPYPDVPASQRPDRLDRRYVHMVTRSGAEYVCARVRGHEPEAIDSTEEAEGLLASVLRRVVGLPTGDVPDHVTAAFLAGGALTHGVNLVGSAAPVPHFPEELRAPEEVRARVAAMSEHDRGEFLSTLMASGFLAGASQLAWAATNDGLDGPAVGLDDDVVAELAQLRETGALTEPTEDSLRVLAGVCQQLRTVPLTTLARVEAFASRYLPTPVVENPDWADERVLAQRLFRDSPGTDHLLSLAEHMGVSDNDPVVYLLRLFEWAPPPRDDA